MLELTEYHRYAMINAPRDAALEIMTLARRINFLTFMHGDNDQDREDALKQLSDVDCVQKVINQISEINGLQ